QQKDAEGVQGRRNPFQHSERNVEDDPGRNDPDSDPDELAIPHPGSPGGDVSLSGRIEYGQPEQDQSQADRDQLAINGRSSHGSVTWGMESGVALRAAA